MSRSLLLNAAASGAGSDPVYVDDVFSTYLYEGTDANQTITNGIDLSGEGGLVWTKRRSASASHYLHDTERGATKNLTTNTTNAEGTLSTGIVSFSSTGYVVGSANKYNGSSNDYVSWTFRKQPGFFDVVTWTGDGTSNRNISHNLGSVPGCIIIKNLSISAAWVVYHRSLPSAAYYLELSNTAAQAFDGDQFSNTAPTDSVFTVGPNSGVNRSGDSFVAYIFAHDAQDFGEDSDEAIIYCDTYEGDGGTQEITLGWEPQWILSKNIDDGSNNWMLMDTMRGAPVDGDTAILEANTNDAESIGSNPTKWYPTPTGFVVKQGGGGGNDPNENNETYIYVAIRRPHKPAEEFAATELFKVDQGDGSTTDPQFVSGFPVDMAIVKTTASGTPRLCSRLTQGRQVNPSDSSAEVSSSSKQFDYMTGWVTSATDTNHYSWMWRRAPGFFDVVAYDGNNTSGRTEAHNLGAVPEMMWFKKRTASAYWECYHSALGATKHINPNADLAARTNSNRFNDTAPTASVFTLGDDGNLNGSSESYIAYLFATVDGISKVGSYSGTGSDVNVDCGFSSGARFILIKRSDSTGDWYVWDSERGIVAGDDPYWLLNDTAAQVTNTDYIDPLSSGFTVTSSAPAGLNASGGTYIFYAIA